VLREWLRDDHITLDVNPTYSGPRIGRESRRS